MSADARVDGVRKFLAGKLDSVEEIHILLLLRDLRGATQTVRKITDELRSTQTSVRLRLDHLVASKVLLASAIQEEEVRYLPWDVATAVSIDELLQLYRERPYVVIEMLFSQPRSAIDSLADAFRFRKDS